MDQATQSLLTALLDFVPVEDGFTHPAEAILETSVKNTDQALAFDEIRQYYLASTDKWPERGAGLLRCMGRLDAFLSYEPLLDLAAAALKHSSPDIREAAITTLEAIGGDKARSWLMAHTEPHPLLRGYLECLLKYI